MIAVSALPHLFIFTYEIFNFRRIFSISSVSLILLILNCFIFILFPNIAGVSRQRLDY